MSEKLYTARCSVAGHNPWCDICQEQHPDKRGLARLRRARDRDVIRAELEEMESDEDEQARDNT
jgi:hypothetical protein